MKVILEYRNHPNIATIKNQCENRASFSFPKLDNKEVEHLILNQDVNSVSKSTNIPLKFVLENHDIYSNFLCASFNSSIKLKKFPQNLIKLASITLLKKKDKKHIKGN